MTNTTRQSEEGARKNGWLLGVVGMLAVAGTVALVWWGYERQNAPEKAVTRSTSDFVVEWRCLGCGHTISANAGVGPKMCPKCSKTEMYASLHWTCPLHGSQTVAFQYDKDGNPTQVKMGTAEWKPAFDAEGAWNIRCPTCGGGMMPGG